MKQEKMVGKRASLECFIFRRLNRGLALGWPWVVIFDDFKAVLQRFPAQILLNLNLVHRKHPILDSKLLGKLFEIEETC